MKTITFPPINPKLQRPCSYCDKQLMWGYHIYRSKRYGGQLHKHCVEPYDSYVEAENALTGKEARNDRPKNPREVPDGKETGSAPG